MYYKCSQDGKKNLISMINSVLFRAKVIYRISVNSTALQQQTDAMVFIEPRYIKNNNNNNRYNAKNKFTDFSRAFYELSIHWTVRIISCTQKESCSLTSPWQRRFVIQPLFIPFFFNSGHWLVTYCGS